MHSTALVTGSRRVAEAAARLGLGSPIVIADSPDDAALIGALVRWRGNQVKTMIRRVLSMTRRPCDLPPLSSPAARLPLDPAADGRPQRPRIGLVLAGGGAKGGAHIGVLKVIEEMRVPVDCIAGTSMGALIGAGYASGQPAAEIEKFITRHRLGDGRRRRGPPQPRAHRAEAARDRAEHRLELGFTARGIVTPERARATRARSTTCCASTSPARAWSRTSTSCRSRIAPSRPT